MMGGWDRRFGVYWFTFSFVLLVEVAVGGQYIHGCSGDEKWWRMRGEGVLASLD